MKIKETQINFILKELRKNGKISRNKCLKNYITRLSAYILELKKDGWIFYSGYSKNGDYEYYVSYPKKYARNK